MKKYIDWKFYAINFVPFIVLAASVIWVKLFNVTAIYENSYYENLAVIPLIIAIVLCFKMKKYKVLFNVIALILILAIAREFSYGRIPFAYNPETNDYNPWSYYKYGYLAHIFIGIYLALTALYAVIKKIYSDIFNILKEIPSPIWSFATTFIFIFIQLYSERVLHADMAEEIAEFVIYTSVMVLSMLYSSKINTDSETEKN